MSRRLISRLGLAGLAWLGALAAAPAARAQYVGPISPYNPPAPGYAPQYYPQYYPQHAPGGFVTGNTTYYDPNAVAGRTGSGSAYWDPQRGWVTDTQNTTVLNSATSAGRAPAAGSQVQYYTYWNGSQYVQGTRWLGQDGLWHGENTNTVVGPNGSTHQERLFYAPNPNARGARASAGYPQQRPTYTNRYRPTYAAPR
jgi:hypothetical protein